MINKKWIMVLVFALAFAPLVFAEGSTPSYIYKQGELIDLKVPVLNNDNSPTVATTICLITIMNPERDAIVNNKPMQYNPNFYNYTINSSELDLLGIYSVKIYCSNEDVEGSDETVNGFTSFTFELNKTGKEFSTTQGIGQVIFISVLFAIFLLCLWGSIRVPYRNPRSDDGFVIGINNLKYLKIFLIVFDYILLMFIFGSAYSISNNLLTFDVASEIFLVLYRIMLAGIFPVVILSMVMILINFLASKKIQKALMRGVPFR